MGKAERERGKRGEREWASVLRLAGFDDARRGVQYSGKGGAADVYCPSLSGFWPEVKRVNKLNHSLALKQAQRDASCDQIAYVASRRDGEDWICTLSGSDFIKLMKDYVEDV